VAEAPPGLWYPEFGPLRRAGSRWAPGELRQEFRSR
jgi:hypothetical protein